MTQSPMQHWLNAACLGRTWPVSREHRQWDAGSVTGVLVSVQDWIREWTRFPDAEIALVESTTAACDAILAAICPEVETILHTSAAHPTIINSAHCAARNVSRTRGRAMPVLEVSMRDIKKVSSDQLALELAARISQLANDEPALLIIEQVSYLEGFRLPVEKIASILRDKQPQLKIVVDGAQATGLWTIDASLFDGFLGCFHKAVAGPAATGFLVTHAGLGKYLPSSAKVMTELPASMHLLPTVDAGKWSDTLSTLMEMEASGPASERQARIATFNARLDQALQPLGSEYEWQKHPDMRSHITTIVMPSESIAAKAIRELAEAGFVVQQFGPAVRISAGRDSAPEWGKAVGTILHGYLPPSPRN